MNYYAARSGIQKAIRRGDVSLTKTCFDMLWADPEHRRWLFWRLPLLVIEEAWHLTGELPTFLRKNSLEERDWRAQYYYLTISLKSKDCYAFPNGMIHPLLAKKDCPELRLIQNWLSELNGRDPLLIADAVFEAVLKNDNPLNEYEVTALTMLRSRVFKGGKYNDRLACVIGMLLLASRGMERGAVREKLTGDLDAYAAAKPKLPKTLVLPWYCYDKHTRLGLEVEYILTARGVLKKHKITPYEFRILWLYEESFFVPKEKMRIPAKPENLTVFDSYWWPRLRVAVCQPKQAKAWEALRPVVSKVVLELQKKEV